jgi:hypothetical protein
MKFLLVISKNYWGAIKSEETAINFLNLFSKYLEIPDKNIFNLINSNLNINIIKKSLYDFIYFNYKQFYDSKCKFYIYMNGHGNQIYDTNQDEIIKINEEESIKDNLDEIYQLPDGIISDDEITNIITDAIKDAIKDVNKYSKKPFICMISDHCSSGSMIDNIKDPILDIFDWVTYGSSLDNQDSLMTGDGNVMTMNLLNLLIKLNKENNLKYITANEFNILLQKEMKESFIGDLQTATFHVSNKNMLIYKIFE